MMDQKNTWPGWETVRLIGRGSFGAVYEIRRDMLDYEEQAALKVITIPQNDSDINDLYSEGYDKDSLTNTFKDHLRSIIGEYALMRKLNGSSNIVNCDDVRYVQHDDGIGWDIYIKMELLTPLINALTPLTEETTAIRIAKDLCQALVLCKRHDIVHRDIKPQNIFVSDNGDYKLGDFGIAKTVEKTSGGTKIGTYKYMAPEVYHNQPYGAGADIYSLGLVMYWMLNEWRLPFMPLPPAPLRASLDEQARMRRFAGEPLPPPAHGSDELKTIVLKACAYDPKDRYQSAEEMLQALQALETAPVSIRQTTGQEAATNTEKQAAAPEADQENATVGIWNRSPQNQASAEEAEEDDVTIGIRICTPPRAPEPQPANKGAEDATVGMWSPKPENLIPVQPSTQDAKDEDATVGIYSYIPQNQVPTQPSAQDVKDEDSTVAIHSYIPQNQVPTQPSAEETSTDDGTVSVWGRQVSAPDADQHAVETAAFKVAVIEKDPQKKAPEQPEAKTESSVKQQAAPNSQKPKKDAKASAPKKKKLLPIAIAGAAAVLLALVLGFIFAGSDAPESLSGTTTPPETNIALQESKPQETKPQETKPQETKPQGTIAIIAKGETHSFWQAVKAGAVDAGNAAGYNVTFCGPTAESEEYVGSQREMVQAALNNNVQGIGLATIGLGFSEQLISAYELGIPIVAFDSGLYDNNADVTAGKDPVIGSVAISNKASGAVAAENLYAYLKAQNVLATGYKVGVIQHDSTSTGIDRAEGFIEKIEELAAADSITLDINRQVKANNPGEYKLGLTALNEWGAQAIFMTNEGVVNEVFPVVSYEAATYKHILFCGFDAGTNQYNWMKDAGANYALLVGSVAQDPYTMGYCTVMMLVDKLSGNAIADIGVAGVWYNAENVDELLKKQIVYLG